MCNFGILVIEDNVNTESLGTKNHLVYNCGTYTLVLFIQLKENSTITFDIYGTGSSTGSYGRLTVRDFETLWGAPAFIDETRTN